MCMNSDNRAVCNKEEWLKDRGSRTACGIWRTGTEKKKAPIGAWMPRETAGLFA